MHVTVQGCCSIFGRWPVSAEHAQMMLVFAIQRVPKIKLP